MRKTGLEITGVQKGYVALFFRGEIISGECRFEATKTAKIGGDAIFDIKLIKPIHSKKKRLPTPSH